MADFLTSTHRAKWIFSPQQLVEKRRAVNERAKQILEKCGSTLMEVDVNGTLSYSESQMTTKDIDETHSLAKPLSIDQEQLVRIFFEHKILRVCEKFPMLPPKIQATALIFLKRFYLQWSVMEHKPKYITLACIYAASKIEESYVAAEELSKAADLQDHQMILKYEMMVYQSLGFDLIVYTPYRSVKGFINDMETQAFCNCNAGDDQLQMLKTLQETAELEVDKMMLTDAPLLFPPGQLALAALRRTNALHKVIDFASYLRSICSRHQSSMHTMSELSESLNAIDSWMEVRNYECPPKKVTRPINEKLTSCWGLRSHDEGKKREKKSKHKSEKKSKHKSEKSSNEVHNYRCKSVSGQGIF